MADKDELEDEPHVISWRVLCLVMVPLGVFLISDSLLVGFGWNGAYGVLTAGDAVQVRGDAAGRLYILTAVLALTGIGVVTALLFAADLVLVFGPRMRRRLLLTFGACMLATGMSYVVRPYVGPIEKYVGMGFMTDAATAFAKREGCAPPTAAAKPAPVPTPKPAPPPCDRAHSPARFLDQLGWLILATIVVSSTAGAMVTVGAVSCLAVPGKSADEAARRAAVALQLRRLRRYVNTGAALMVSGILLGFAWMRWPMPLLAGEAAKAYLAHIDALAVYFGVSYSLLIASFAGPIAWLLRARFAALPRIDGDPQPDLNLFDKSVLDSLGKILVVLSPALAALLPAAFDMLNTGAH